jgi:Natural resistance-associated macrophage protein-like
VPGEPSSALYAYYAVGLVAAALMPYEIYFYSSGAVEEHWKRSDLTVNRLNAVIGYGLGGLLSVGLMIVAAQVFLPAGVEPGTIGTVALGAQIPFGEAGLVLAMLGIFFALGGAAIDSGLIADALHAVPLTLASVGSCARGRARALILGTRSSASAECSSQATAQATRESHWRGQAPRAPAVDVFAAVGTRRRSGAAQIRRCRGSVRFPVCR